MLNVISQLIATINTYQRPLERYANYMVKNKLVAALIVQDVFDDYSKLVSDIPHSEIRSFLKTNTLAKCRQWNACVKGK